MKWNDLRLDIYRLRDEHGAVGFIQMFLLLAVILAGFIIANSDVFRLRHIQVYHNRQVTKEEIILASGIDRRQTVFQVKPEVVAAQIEKNPMIKRANVEIQPPDTVRIRVEERVPLVWVAYQKQYVCIAEDGVVLAGPGPRDGFRLPLVTGCAMINPEPGKSVRAKKFDEILAIMALMDQPLREITTEIDLRNYRLYLRTPSSSRIPADLGNMDKLEAKIANLRAIVSHEKFHEFKGINLRVPDIPTVISR
ncbi:MAG TPA: FtsQ-type POTRA domain-containing protein [Bacillota bacterium]|nr:FtsQ-type POTRA domain-containing protein [Bacillota bacterium]HPT87883.1 FtsQ-type POTRA domain-containing protein [Bacillota bacterium]